MSDKQNAIDVVDSFLESDKKILLLKGYDNDAKVMVSLMCLNEFFDRGIIRTSNMSKFSGFIFDAFHKDLLPRNVNSTTNYKLGKMIVNISSYVTNTKRNPKGNDSTFTLYHPVQTVLDNEKLYNNLIEELEKNQSKKIIIITTNEWSIDNWEIENYVDEVYFYSVENDNPDIMSNLRSNKAI
ncbi:hypothetical protein CKN80_09425 [Carnobacterium divergens]|uniref:hypothetical protein n=1 Tax=Carnobacterium divergens TaxID=2748 RepID=UPI0010722A2E|nr:hypothetical protein [Carnobacterium divergens]TFJ43939.1 hypothetical protein CKN79_07820 [Carnobacterium divergens]TFJ51166.1 hypothetical protein CKN80_09425 [Carnobacterium divergens]